MTVTYASRARAGTPASASVSPNRKAPTAPPSRKAFDHELHRALAARTCDLAAAEEGENAVAEELLATDEELARSAPARRGLQPRQGDATIVCNGSGGYRVALNGWAGRPCGIEACVRSHEEQHITDWQGRWPNGCKDKADGAQIPLGGAGYAAFLRASECSAYTVELACAERALAAATDACKPTLRTHIADTRAQRTSFCS